MYDKWAAELPDVGLLKVVDAETGYEQYVDTGSRKLRRLYAQDWNSRQRWLDEMFNRSKVDHVSVTTDGDYVKALRAMFAKRIR